MKTLLMSLPPPRGDALDGDALEAMLSMALLSMAMLSKISHHIVRVPGLVDFLLGRPGARFLRALGLHVLYYIVRPFRWQKNGLFTSDDFTSENRKLEIDAKRKALGR